MISLVNATEDNNCSYTHLFALNLFTLEQKKLQVGGALLPDLIEFYKWIHTQLSHLMTYERAKQISIGQVINLTAKRYSSEICDHLTSLFKRINSKHRLCVHMCVPVIVCRLAICRINHTVGISRNINLKYSIHLSFILQ